MTTRPRWQGGRSGAALFSVPRPRGQRSARLRAPWRRAERGALTRRAARAGPHRRGWRCGEQRRAAHQGELERLQAQLGALFTAYLQRCGPGAAAADEHPAGAGVHAWTGQKHGMASI